MDKNLKKFIIMLSTMQIINNNNNIDDNININKNYIKKKTDNVSAIYSDSSQLFIKMNNFFNLNLFFPVLTSGHHILLYFKSVMENTNTINLTNKEIILYDKIFNYDILYTKKNKKLIIVNPGIGFFSFSQDYTSLYYLSKLFNDGFNIIVLNRNFTNLEKSLYYYNPFDISKYLHIFINIISNMDDYKSNIIYLLGLSGGCYTILKYLSNKSLLKPKQLKSSILISSSPNIEKNILDMNTLLSTRINYTIVKSINLFKNDYNLKFNDSLYTTIGKIGIKNNNLNSYKDYYNTLNVLNTQLNNIEIPIIFLNSEDDNIAHIKYLKEYINDYSENPNFNYLITKFGWHGLFYNKEKNFIEKIIIYFFD